MLRLASERLASSSLGALGALCSRACFSTSSAARGLADSDRIYTNLYGRSVRRRQRQPNRALQPRAVAPEISCQRSLAAPSAAARPTSRRRPSAAVACSYVSLLPRAPSCLLSLAGMTPS